MQAAPAKPRWQEAFPDFPASDMPAVPAGFEDQSYRNDACPCFINEDTGLCIWVDYAAPDMRETVGARFAVSRLTYGGDVGWQHDGSGPVLVTDDWAAVLSFVAPRAAAWRIAFFADDGNGDAFPVDFATFEGAESAARDLMATEPTVTWAVAARIDAVDSEGDTLNPAWGATLIRHTYPGDEA